MVFLHQNFFYLEYFLIINNKIKINFFIFNLNSFQILFYFINYKKLKSQLFVIYFNNFLFKFLLTTDTVILFKNNYLISLYYNLIINFFFINKIIKHFLYFKNTYLYNIYWNVILLNFLNFLKKYNLKVLSFFLSFFLIPWYAIFFNNNNFYYKIIQNYFFLHLFLGNWYFKLKLL